MKLRPVSKLNKGNTETLEKLDNDVVSKNCDVIVIFPFYG